MGTKPFVVITGACGGIGEELVIAFAKAGYRVIGTDLEGPARPLPIERFFAFDLERLGDDSPESTDFFRTIRQILDGAGLRALVNNAAVQIVKPVEELTAADLMRTLTVNAVAPFLLAKELLLDLKLVGGSIVNISSIHARLTKPNFVAYSTSKAALSGLTRAMAVELGCRVRVNAIAPAAIRTTLLKAGFQGHEEDLLALAEVHPTRRIGEPAEVATLAVFLASDHARFINGACFELDGGIGSRLHDPA